MSYPAERWATATAEQTTRDAGEPGVRLRCYLDLRQELGAAPCGVGGVCLLVPEVPSPGGLGELRVAGRWPSGARAAGCSCRRARCVRFNNS
ncbi:DUF6207 family protein [Streptomyces xiangluensis]|uniref:DUF6207 family protein n=1 Tax=Streptomyces xiangluensis TaxID=2665720 RepID=A0ABV8YK43_9ACTN